MSSTTQALPRYVVFGEALTDMVRRDDGLWSAMPGGSCWNVARVAARLGVSTAFAGAVSRDLFGDDIAQASEQAGLDLRFLQRVDASPFLAMVTAKNPPKYFFIGENSADLKFDPAKLPEGWRQSAEVLHFGGLSLVRSPLSQRLVNEASEAKAAGKRIAFDPNFREFMQAPDYADTFRTMVGIADYIKVSDEDLAGIFPSMLANERLATLRAMAPVRADVLFTRGEAGMTWLRGDAVCEQPAFRVPVADTVGCGDAAMGGWIYGLLTNPAAPPVAHLEIAAAAAALSATQTGPYAPAKEEVMNLIAASAKTA